MSKSKEEEVNTNTSKLDTPVVPAPIERKSLFIIHKTEADKVKIILNNVLLMLSNRMFIAKNGEKTSLMNYEEAVRSVSDKGDNTFLVKANNGEIYAIRIIFQKISATGKQSAINDFIKEYTSQKKIIIANDYNNKILDYVSKQGIQIFRENIMLEDLISHYYQPKFELMTPTEAEDYKREYNVDDYGIKKMMKSDPVARYFGLKKGDLIKIIRPSPLSGENPDCRIVS